MPKPPKSNSLLFSLVLRISLVSIVSIIALSGIVYSQIDRTLESLRAQTVEEQAKSISSYLKPSRGINKVFLNMPGSLRQFYVRMGDAYQYMVRDREGNRLFVSPVIFADSFPADLSRPRGAFEFTGPSGRHFSGFTMATEVEGQRLYIQVAQVQGTADTFSDEITHSFLNRLLWVGIPFYLCLLIVIMLTLKRGLNPLHRAAEEVGKMDISDLSLRIAEAEVPKEVLPFVQAVNFSFSRLERSLKEQQEFTENVAHELRTPLTILKTRIDTMNRDSQTEKLSRDVDSMIKLVNQMLDATRLEYADMLKKQEVDLAEVLSQACQDFFPLFVRADRELRVEGVGSPVPVEGNKDLIYRAICNLLDNALEYSPPKTPVEAVLEGHVIRITDHGRKIPEQRRRIIFERFQKDSSPSAHKSGAGLGLSIVTRTMEIHGGYADLEEKTGGGNTFRMVFRPGR